MNMIANTAPNPLDRPQRATVAFRLTLEQAARCGLAERFLEAVNRREARAKKIFEAQAALDAALAIILERAATEKWSQRQLAAKIAIPQTTFRRLRASQVDPLHWLPKIEEAAQRLLED